MEDIVKGEIGKEGAYDVDLVDGKVKVSLSYQGSQAGASVSAEIGLDLLLDKLAEKFESELVKSLLAILKVAIKSL